MFKWRLLATDHHLPFYINTAKEVLKWIDDVRDMLIDERYQAALTALDSMDWLCPCVAAACAESQQFNVSTLLLDDAVSGGKSRPQSSAFMYCVVKDI